MTRSKSKAFNPGLIRKAAAQQAADGLPAPLAKLKPFPLVVEPDAAASFAALRFPGGLDRFDALERVHPNLPVALAAVLNEYRASARIFGASGPKELSVRLLAYLASLELKAKDEIDFRRAILGYKRNVKGRLWHWAAENDPGLTDDLERFSESQVHTVKRIAQEQAGRSPAEIAQSVERIVDAHGTTVTLPADGSFAAPLRAGETMLVMKNGTVKAFVDSLWVSLYRRGSAEPTHMNPAAFVEYKFRWGIQKAGGQLEAAPGRLTDAAELVVVVGGRKYSFKPGQVVFQADKSVDPVSGLSAWSSGPDLNQFAVTHVAETLVTRSTPRAIYGSDLDELLGSMYKPPSDTPGAMSLPAPQVTPLVAREGRVRGVLVEMALDPRLIMRISDLVIGR